MTLTVLFLLSVALFSMFALHQKKNTETAVQEILDNYSVGQIYNEYQRHNRALWGFFVAGVLLTGGFAITYFSGKDLDLNTWKAQHYIFAAIGLAVTLTITNGQRLLYQNISTHGIAFAVTLVILVFVYVSEISTQGERSELIMKERSKDSPTLAATLDAVRTQAGKTNTNPYSGQIANAERLAGEHRSKLAECETKYKSERRKVRCREYERAKMTGYETEASIYRQQAETTQSASGETLTHLISEGKKLENNEENYQAFIKFTKGFYGVTAITALTFIGFILVNAFEVLFHFIGVRTGILREALLRSGYSLEPEPPTPDDINAELKYKREKRRAKFTKKTRDYARKLERKNRKNRPPPLPSNDRTGNDNNTVPENRSGDRTDEKKRKHTLLSDTDNGEQNNQPIDRTGQIQTEGKEKVWFPELLYNAVKGAILARQIKPTVRPAHLMVSEGLREGLQDEKGKHRHYTKPETQEITVFILDKLEQEKVILINTKGGVGKAKYILNKAHSEVLR